MTVIDDLQATRDYLTTVGWKQGSFGGEGTPACLLGAVRTVGDGDFLRVSQMSRSIDLMLRALDYTGGVVSYNDDKANSVEDVTSLIDLAILWAVTGSERRRIDAGLTGPSRTIEVQPEPTPIPDTVPDVMPDEAPVEPQRETEQPETVPAGT